MKFNPFFKHAFIVQMLLLFFAFMGSFINPEFGVIVINFVFGLIGGSFIVFIIELVRGNLE